MEFFRGRSLTDLRPMLHGPARMKDIRLLRARRRPGCGLLSPARREGRQGQDRLRASRDSLDCRDGGDDRRGSVCRRQFAAGEWGGANEAQVLADGSLGVLGHIAQWGATGCRHYYPMAFTLDPDRRCTTPDPIIATRDMFPAAATKRADLVDVVFSGGLMRHANGYATLWAGTERRCRRHDST